MSSHHVSTVVQTDPVTNIAGVYLPIYEAIARLVKLVGSAICHACTQTCRKILQLQGKPIPGTFVVLCYHAVPHNQRARFARQMDLLLQYSTPIQADVETAFAAGEHYSALTFDDVYQSTVENAIPELKARSIPCTLFAVSHLPGHTPWWSGKDGFDSGEKFVTAEQLVNMPGELVSIGSHTMTHPNLPTLSMEKAKRELYESREFLQQTLAREIKLFAFPHGAFSKSLVTWCREAGYQRVFSIEPTMTFSETAEYVTGRIVADPADWDCEFRLKLLGAYRWLPFVYRMKRRLGSLLKRLFFQNR